jgi:hypothetical protein
MANRTLARNISDSNGISIDFLISDARVALTFLDLAETTRIAEDRGRRIKEAKQAYDSILCFLPRATPTDEQGEALGAELAKLKERLRAFFPELSEEDVVDK